VNHQLCKTEQERRILHNTHERGAKHTNVSPSNELERLQLWFLRWHGDVRSIVRPFLARRYLPLLGRHPQDQGFLSCDAHLLVSVLGRLCSIAESQCSEDISPRSIVVGVFELRQVRLRAGLVLWNSMRTRIYSANRCEVLVPI
jgi:hypothetical protein